MTGGRFSSFDSLTPVAFPGGCRTLRRYLAYGSYECSDHGENERVNWIASTTKHLAGSAIRQDSRWFQLYMSMIAGGISPIL